MLKNKSILLWFVLFLTGLPAHAQDYSNKGKDFWVIYMGHIDGTSSRMALYITSDQNATGTLNVNGSSLPFTVTANQVTTLRLTNATTPSNSLAYNAQVTGTGTNKGIHIITDNPVVVYAHVLNSARSGASMVLPTTVLGREYFVSTYASVGSNASAKAEFAVCATEDNTTVEITPTQADANNTHAANTAFQVTLNKGDVYQYQSANNGDLTGTSVKSVASASAPCKPISVFAGSMWTAMGCANANSGDNLYQQLFPQGSWGMTYITAPFISRSYDIFRIMVKDPATNVSVNGVPLPLASLQLNSYYEINTNGNNTPRIISADKPVSVAQYLITQNCDGVNADPEMVILSPVEQTIKDVTVLSARADLTPPNTNITRHYLNIIIPTTGLSGLRIDGALPVASPVAIPSTVYSYIREDVTNSTNTNPAHRITADSGFLAIAYGYGNVESYGYNAGANVRDLYQFITVQNPYATVNFPAACKSSPFYFSIVFPYQPTAITWDFHGLFANVTLTNPVYDSTWIVNGKPLYRYKLTTPYTINAVGNYPITVTAQNPTPDGCSGTQTIEYTLQVFDQPLADFTSTTPCFPDPVQFTDISTTGGRPVISRLWDFGDLSTGTANNPSHTYTTAGTYNVQYSLITDVGCLSDTTSHLVEVSPLPTGGISGSTTVCLGAPSPNISFNGVVGTPPFTFTYTINGGPQQTITTNLPGNIALLPVPTNTAGTFTYALVKIQDSSPGACSQTLNGTAVVVVNPLPSATAVVNGSATVCKLSNLPEIVFTGLYGSPNYTFYYHINSGPELQEISTSAGTASVFVPTSTPGVYTYTIDSVKDGSPLHCMNYSVNVSVTVTIIAPPTVSLSSSQGSVCQGGAPPTVTFTGSGGTPPYHFTYVINNGAPLFISTSPTSSSVTFTVPTGTPGTFYYRVLHVSESSPYACEQDAGSGISVTVVPVAIPDFTISGIPCPGKTIRVTDNSTFPAPGNYVWNWGFGDPGSPGNVILAGFPDTSHVYMSPGTYTINMTVVNWSSVVCQSATVSKIFVIHPDPVAGFILPDVCLNDTYAQFTDTSRVLPPDAVIGWHWNFGDPGSGVNNTSALQNPQHSYTATGSYPIWLDVVTNAGCRDTVQTSLYVNGSFPLADFTVNSPATLCANDSVSITDASSVFPGNITKVEIYWDNTGTPTVFDTDDTPVPGRVYKHLYPNFQTPLTQTFTIRYRAYSGGVCVNDKFRTVIVNAAPKVQFSPIPNVCLDAAPFALTQGTELGGVPGSGHYSGPGISGTNTFNPAVAGPGTHTLTYTYVSNTGGCADSLQQTIHVYAAAVPDFSVVSPVCETRTITFNQNASSSEGSLVSWVWDFADGSPAQTFSNGNPVTHVFNTWGTYNVKLHVITSNGCVSPDKMIPVTVHPLPHPGFSYPVSLCLPNANATFSNLTSIADGTQSSITYLWNFGDPPSGVVNTSTATNPSHMYVTNAVYAVNLQATSADGCVKDTTINVTTIHSQPQASFTTDKPSVCVGDAFRFTDASNQMGGTATSWNWNMGDGNTRTAQAFNYTYASAGAYTISLFTYNTWGCRSNDYSATLNVYPYPVVDAGPDRLVLEGGQITLNPVVTGNSLTYLWTPNTYISGSNTIPNIVVNGVHDIRYLLTVTAQGGCKDTSSVFVKVLYKPAVPTIFSPNGDGVHDTWQIQYLESYPGCTVDIYNRYGQPIFHSVGYAKPWDGTVHGAPAPVGTYYYIIDPKNGRERMSGYVDVIR